MGYTPNFGRIRMVNISLRVLIVCLSLASGKVLIPVDVDEDITNRTAGGCPTFAEIPVANLHEGHPEKDYFYGGRFYQGAGSDIPALACTGYHFDMEDGYKHSATPGNFYPFGSLMVNPGCTWYLFEGYNYEGRYVEYSGGNTGMLVSKVPRPSWGGTCGAEYGPCFPSYLVSCQQRFPNCAPEDGWSTIATLDNSLSSVETPFTFQQTIGTTWSNEVSESAHWSASVEASISTNFFGAFEASMGFSVETGMDWGSVSKQEKSKTDTYKVGPINIPAGMKVWVEAAIGYCGGSTVETHMYRVISSTGELMMTNE